MTKSSTDALNVFNTVGLYQTCACVACACTYKKRVVYLILAHIRVAFSIFFVCNPLLKRNESKQTKNLETCRQQWRGILQWSSKAWICGGRFATIKTCHWTVCPKPYGKESKRANGGWTIFLAPKWPWIIFPLSGESHLFVPQWSPHEKGRLINPKISISTENQSLHPHSHRNMEISRSLFNVGVSQNVGPLQEGDVLLLSS